MPPAETRSLRRWLDRLAPAVAPQNLRRDGYLCDGGPERLAWAIALALTVGAAIAFEWIAARTPIPPGGDEGTWLVLSYPYVGIAAPSSVHLFSYPPLSLPFLGLAVALAGGPLNGARLFVGVVLVGLGLSAYALGRSMFRWRAVALLFEAALLLQPDFQQLQYFGAYPNLFGFVFLFLAVAFGLRFLRSRRSWHLGLFWGTATAAVLSHALVAVILVAMIGIAGIGLLAQRRFPRELITTWTGRIGGAAFAGLGLLYYAGGWVAGTPRPDYLYTTILTPSQSATQLGAVFHAFYLEPLSILVHAGAFSFTYQSALALLWALIAVLVVGFALVRWRRPDWASDRVLVLVSWFLAVFAVALLTWYLALTADYRRFTYFLYPANLLLIALVGDIALTTAARRAEPEGPSAAGAPPARGRLRRPSAVSAILAAAAVVLIVGGTVYTVPAAIGYDNENSHVAHGDDFLAAMRAITSSGIPGAIFSGTPVVDRWPTALTGHALYEVRPPMGYTYTANNLETDELAALSDEFRDTVTNGQVLLALPGAAPADLNATPLYGIYQDGLVRSIFVVPPSTIAADVANLGWEAVEPAAGVGVSWTNSSAPGAVPSLILNLSGTGFSVRVTLTAPPSGATARLQFVAAPSGPNAILALRVNLTAAGDGTGGARAGGPSGFVWAATANGGALPTYGNLSGGGSLTVVGGSEVSISASAGAGAQNASVALALTTPGTSNPVGDEPSAIDSNALWLQWSVRFVLLWNGSAGSGNVEATYLEQEYGASLFSVDGPWTVLLWNGIGGA